MSDKWMTIDSAPKDGSMFLATNGDEWGCLSISPTGYEDKDGPEYIWLDHGFQFTTQQPEPTHWRPMPKTALRPKRPRCSR